MEFADSKLITERNLSRSNFAENLWGPRRDPLSILIPLTLIYSFIFIFGFIGNIITCIVIYRNRYMHTATNYYLFSLAISDLLLLIFGLPSEMHQMWSRYPYEFGETFCILQGLAAETSANATVLTITAFTVERYVAICYPFFSHKISKLSRAMRYVIYIWITSLILAIPQAIQMGIIYGEDNNGNAIEELTMCGLKNPFIAHSFEISTVLFFIVPMTIITALYILIGLKLRQPNMQSNNRKAIKIRNTNVSINNTSEQFKIYLNNSKKPQHKMYHSTSTKKVVKMLVAVVAAFFVCWAPFQAQRIIAIYGYQSYTTNPIVVMIYQYVTYISGVLYYFSTIVNPILYNIMSNKFRKAFKDTLRNCRSGISGKEHSNIHLSSGIRKHYCEDKYHHNSACSKNSNTCQNAQDLEEIDLSKRPIVVSFSKCSGSSNSKQENSQILEFECSSNCKHEPALIIHPNCKCAKISNIK